MLNVNLKNFFKFYKIIFLLKIILFVHGADQKEKTKTRSPQVTAGVPIGILSRNYSKIEKLHSQRTDFFSKYNSNNFRQKLIY